MTVVLVARLALGASVARAEDPAAAARETFRAAIALEAAGDWSGALARLREVAATRTTPQVRFHIARCQEKLGKWTAAIGTYRLAIGEAELVRANDVAREADAARVALEAQLPHLTLSRGAGAEAVSVSLDGIEIGETSLNTQIGLDPGPHTIEAFENRERRSLEIVTLAPRENTLHTLRILRTEHDSKSTDEAREDRRDGAPGPTSSRVPAYVLLGAGAAALAGSVTLWSLRSQAVSDLEARCAGSHCPASLAPTAEHGRLYSGLAIGTGAVALGALGTGGFLLWTSRRPDREQAPLAGSSVSLIPAGSSVSLAGRF